MTGYMRPAQMTIYTSEPTNVMHTFKLVPDPGGDVALLEGFVDPVLVYADLVNTADARAIEAAHQLYEQHIQSRYQ
jgi:hypothetical protein